MGRPRNPPGNGFMERTVAVRLNRELSVRLDLYMESFPEIAAMNASHAIRILLDEGLPKVGSPPARKRKVA